MVLQVLECNESLTAMRAFVGLLKCWITVAVVHTLLTTRELPGTDCTFEFLLIHLPDMSRKNKFCLWLVFLCLSCCFCGFLLIFLDTRLLNVIFSFCVNHPGIGIHGFIPLLTLLFTRLVKFLCSCHHLSPGCLQLARKRRNSCWFGQFQRFLCILLQTNPAFICFLN
uniref:Uncharacterized protein n=1 Tax=Lutzomyia longipalpis TaxID=7200 RepID=A0A1B0CDG9_LUTLO